MAETLRRFAGVTLVGVAAVVAVAVLSWPASYHESRGTYVLRVSASDENDRARAVANLLDEGKIPRTYARAMESDLIERRAIDAVGADRSVADHIDVDATLAGGTAVIEVSVRGDDPELVSAMAQAVGAEAVAFSVELEDFYRLEPLDPPGAATKVRPALSAVDLLVIALAGVSAFLVADRLRRPFQRGRLLRAAGVGPDDDLDRADRYTHHRYREERARADRGGPPCGIVVMTVGVQRSLDASTAQPSEPRRPDPERIRRRLEATLRPQDHLCAVDGRGTFAALVPGLTAEETEQLADIWQTAATDQLRRRRHRLVDIRTSTCTYAAREYAGGAEAIALARSL